MDVFVISLTKSIERRQNIRQQFDGADLKFRFFDAIDACKDKQLYFRNVDVQAFYENTGRTVSVGEIGCYASHLTLWRACVVLERPIIILEDDVVINRSIKASLPSLFALTNRLGFVRLEANPKRLGARVTGLLDRNVYHCPRYPFGATAYAISPKVAQRFIDASCVMHAPVDKFIKNFWEHKQPLFCVAPALAKLGPNSKHSTIGPRHKKWRPWRARAIRCVRTLIGSARRQVFNLSVNVNAQPGSVMMTNAHERSSTSLPSCEGP